MTLQYTHSAFHQCHCHACSVAWVTTQGHLGNCSTVRVGTSWIHGVHPVPQHLHGRLIPENSSLITAFLQKQQFLAIFSSKLSIFHGLTQEGNRRFGSSMQSDIERLLWILISRLFQIIKPHWHKRNRIIFKNHYLVSHLKAVKHHKNLRQQYQVAILIIFNCHTRGCFSVEKAKCTLWIQMSQFFNKSRKLWNLEAADHFLVKHYS